jgi:hypothetical protein
MRVSSSFLISQVRFAGVATAMTRRFGLNGRDPVSEFGDSTGEVRFAELISALALVSVGMMPEPREADAVLLLARCAVALAAVRLPVGAEW